MATDKDKKASFPKKLVTDKDYTNPKTYWQKMRAAGFERLGINNDYGNNKRAIKDPAQLWELACCYFQYCDENPILKSEMIKGGELAGTIKQIPVQRPYNFFGLDRFLCEHGIIKNLDDYRYNTQGQYDEYKEVIDKINSVMYSQKYEHAAVNIFNSTIIARDLKLTEHVETKQEIKVESDIDYSKLSDSALEEIANLKK